MNSLQKKVKRELTRLWTGELAAAGSFWICFLVIKGWLVNIRMLISVIYPLIILTLVLVQGAIYWLILLKRRTAPQFAVKYTGRLYRIMKAADAFLLCLGLPVIVMNHNNIAVTVLSAFILIFAVIEWINYYQVRLSYGYNLMILLRHIKNGTLKKSRLAKEIKRD